MPEMGPQRIAFGFDKTKSFEENCEAFLEAVTAVDPEMATILRNHWEELASIVSEGQRDSRARSDFNEKVSSDLDSLLAKSAKTNGGS